MERLFEGIPLQSINTSMTINATAPFILSLYLVVAEKTRRAWTELRGTTQNDLLKEFVARGTSIFHPDLSFRLSTDLIRFAVERVPNWNPNKLLRLPLLWKAAPGRPRKSATPSATRC